MKRQNSYIRALLLLMAVIVVNGLSGLLYHRFDLTADQRYTLSDAALHTLDSLESPLLVEVLLDGKLPAEFRRLQLETRQLLEEFSAHNRLVKYTFVDPVKNEDNAPAVQQELAQIGILPAQVSTQEGGRTVQEWVFPWAIVSHKDRAVKVPLLKNHLGTDTHERVNNSIQHLEYALADAFGKLLTPKKHKVAVLKGNGQLDDIHIADFFTTLKEYYYIAPFTLDSVAGNAPKVLEQLQGYDLVVSAKPTEPFSDAEKYVLDQYLMQGGKALWLLDEVGVEMDDLMVTGSTFALRRDLNLTDMFFRYGFRINPVLVNDPYSAPLVLARGQDSDTRYDPYPWFYAPLSSGAQRHPIVNNIEAVRFDFANTIDTLENKVQKTVLLSSSPLTRVLGTPREIALDEIEQFLQITQQGPDPALFSAGEQPLAVLLEGRFTSAFKNRIRPFEHKSNREESHPTKMIVVADGDIIKNQLDGNRPMELGFDKWTRNRYGNKDFLLNAVNYLLDDNGLINIRSKEVSVAFLDPEKIRVQRSRWQWVNVALPVVLLLVFGSLFMFLRHRRYTR